MNWRPVARLMALDARRSAGLWGVVALIVLVSAAAAGLPALIIGDSLSAGQALTFLVGPLKLLVALAGLLGGYGAIAGPRSGGQLQLLLGQPVGRGAMVVGAFVGRATVVLGGVAVGLAAVAGTLTVVYGELPARRLAGLAGLLALFALSVTALATGLSAAAGTRERAAVAAVGAFVLFEFFWGVVPAGAYYLVEGSVPGPVVPAWVVLLERSQPLSAFEAAAPLAVPRVEAGIQLSPGDAPTATGLETTALADRLGGPAPPYLDPWAAVATLVGWTVVPLLAGWYRFRQADLQ